MQGFCSALATFILPLLLCGRFLGAQSCAPVIDPFAPIGWIASGVKTAAKGVYYGARGAYRLAVPTKPSVMYVMATDPSAPKSGFKPMGCFIDKESKPDLPFEGGEARKMNKQRCAGKCKKFGTKYFGLQSHPTKARIVKCWCGNFFGLYGKGTKYDCENRCHGEEDQVTELCGGDMFNSVYEMKKN